ncbi:hypothetical protein BDR03DRAFT_935890 [Suillus americanus]|nr:hypothetical protein BDR03DRAFT_935890 [Suillus americanus]
MVSCGALHCTWERNTDFRGLSRHRSTCRYYQRASTLATQKRRDRAQESTLQHLTSQFTAASITTSSNPNQPPRRIQRVLLTLRDSLQTAFSVIGLCRQYPRWPSFEPDKFVPSTLLSKSCPTTNPPRRVSEPPFPFPNMTIYRLMTWMNSGSHQKSETEVMHLVKDVIHAEDFNPRDLEGFSVRRSLHALDDHGEHRAVTFLDDWVELDITLDIPTKSKDDPSRSFSIPGFYYRPLVAVIRSAFTDIQASAFHLFPFKRLWKDPLDGHQECVFDELYSSDSWLEAQEELQRQPREHGCSLERYACLAPKSDNIKDVLSTLPRISKSGMAALHAHCRQDLFHACWKHLLDADFLQAYHHGIVLQCPDGILRRVFPRIFTYSADYPEKVLIAMIKDMGSCPCPRCLIPKTSFDLLGLFGDMRDRLVKVRTYCLAEVIKARRFIYKFGNTVDGSKVRTALGEGSWVPTVNAFAETLGPLGFDTFRMLVIDFMHECELATWKALFTHLIRLLYALPGGDGLVAFICKFANNTSEIKKLAAWDFEDILQCAMPIFEGLFPEDHDKIVQSLLYRFAQWHALAKLRIHSETTLSVLDSTFTRLSHQLRHFQDFTCAVFTTVELPRETAACEHSNNRDPSSGSRKVKKFNMNTYKYHAMGDYLRSIRLFGTIDSFTSQIVCDSLNVPVELPEFKNHHYIPKLNCNNPIHIFTFLHEHGDDPAVVAFIPKLKDHILYRLRQLDVSHCDHTFTDDEHNSVIISDNRLYSVQTMQVHYTTYDLRREYDNINPRTHSDVMVLSGETRPQHPYWYARVLGIYHMDILLNVEGPFKTHQIEVLYVRWLAPLTGHHSGMKCARLPKIAFVEDTDSDAFGFLDPTQVIRGAHLIPAFSSGRGTTSLYNWEVYCVGIFVDCDMFMRYTHYGIGHPTALRKLTKDCADADLADSPESEEDETNGDWESNLQPCEGDSERESCDDDGGEEVQEDVDDDQEDFKQDDDSEESSVNDPDDVPDDIEDADDDRVYF